MKIRLHHTLLSLIACLLTAASGAETAKPNVILILADDLGHGEIGCYGGPVKTPHMNRLATDGVDCTDGYAAFPVCSPSRAPLLTGRYTSVSVRPSRIILAMARPNSIRWSTSPSANG